MMRLAVAFLFCTLLVGCSGNDKPAPVRQADKYQQHSAGSLRQSTYTVKKGDTLYFISYLAGVPLKELMRINGLSERSVIYPGQKLRLPTSAGGSIPAKAGTASQSQNKPQQSDNKGVASPPQKAYAEPPSATIVPAGAKIAWRWPTSGQIIRGFSSAENGNKGIDISGKPGQAIYAAADGQVVYAGSALRGYGQLIIIKHSNDFISAYAHNSQLKVKEQQTVKVGQHIADMGASGTTSTRLHFEIRYQGKAVNPLSYLPKR